MRRLRIPLALGSLIIAAVAFAEVLPTTSASTIFGAMPTRAGSTTRLDSSKRVEAFRVHEKIGQIAQTITVHVPAHAGGVRGARLYADRRGKLGRLLAQGSVAGPKRGGWVKVPIKPTALARDHVYWIALLGRGGIVESRTDVVLTASDASGSATSARPAIVSAPPAPTAAFNYSPASPVTGQSVHFDGTATTCAASPCTYTWADEPPTGGTWPLGSGPTIDFTFSIAATKYVTLSVTDSLNRTATVERDVVVASAPPTNSSPPTNTTAPAITGQTVQGQTLSTSNGSWTGNPTSYAYQWQDCTSNVCSNISEATGSSYKLQSSDLGDAIDVMVTASNASGSRSATSARSAIVSAPPAPTAAFNYSPASPVTGQSVHFDGTATTCAASPCTYTWADEPPTGGTWPLGSGPTIDFTFSIAATKYVTLSVTDSLNRTATVERDVVVAAAPPTNSSPPGNTSPPMVSGQAVQGQKLSTSNGSWSGSPTSYAYTWQDCNSSGASCTDISGAASSSYTLQASDVGSTIRSVVTATNGGGSASASSAATAAVSGTAPTAPANTSAPAVSGQTVQGQSLSTSNGSWSGSPTSYSYQWQDCNSSGASCTDISGAASSSYTLQASDVGSTIRSVVTATNGGGSASASSAATAAVSGTAPTAPAGPLSCNVNATTSNFTTQIANATAGQVVCLALGDYSGFTGTSKSAPGITITSAPGATVTFNSGFKLNLSSVQNFMLDGTGGGGTMTIGGEVDMETSGDAPQNKALNLTFQNIAFTAAEGNVLLQGEENSNIIFNRDTFVDANAKCSGGSATGLSGIFYVQPTASPTTQTGLTVENSVFVAPTDLWNPGRAVQDGAPMAFENNVVTGFLDHTESARLQPHRRPADVQRHQRLDRQRHVHRQPVLRRLRVHHGIRRHLEQHDHRQRLLRHGDRLYQPLLRHWVGRQPQHPAGGRRGPGRLHGDARYIGPDSGMQQLDAGHKQQQERRPRAKRRDIHEQRRSLGT